jgi:hypothetical protein
MFFFNRKPLIFYFFIVTKTTFTSVCRELKEHFSDYTEQVVKLMVPMLKFYFHDGVRQVNLSSCKINSHLSSRVVKLLFFILIHTQCCGSGFVYPGS